MVSTLEATNLDTPITPACNKSISAPAVETSVSLYTTPETDGEKVEDEPRTPQKESSMKKKGNRIGSKRKLFLQSGSSGSQNKVKKMSSMSITKPKKVATPIVTSPTMKTSPNGAAPKEAAWPSYPLTERQQLQYLLEVTAKEAQNEPQEPESNKNQVQMFTRLKKKDAIKKEANMLRISKRNERGETLLHLAAIKGDVEETISLIKGGISVNAKDYAGWTPLHEACNFGHINIVDELLKAGAKVNVPGYEDVSPLHDAVINNHVQVVELLLKYGADPCQTTMQGFTAIDLGRSASILELLHSARWSSTTMMAPPSAESSPINSERQKETNQTSNQGNLMLKESPRASVDKGCVPDLSPLKYSFVRSSSLEQNYTYSRRSSSSSMSQISDVDDSIDPKRLNECLDKAMLEMSSYLDPKENDCEFMNQRFPKNSQAVLVNSSTTELPFRSKNLEEKKLCDQQNAENKQNSMINGQSYLNMEEKNGGKISGLQENEPMKQQLDLKNPISEDGNSNKENQPAQKTRTPSDNTIFSNLNQNVCNSKMDVRNSSEVSKAIQDCCDHIKNPTWRKALEKQYYSASSLPLYVPGYKKFMMSSKAYTLHNQDSKNSNPSSESDNVEESELTRLKSAHQVEREKLQLCLEQEIVRLFGSFARRAIGKDVPIGACTIIQQQMKTHGRQEKKTKSNTDKLSGQSIKTEVDQILQKFGKLKNKLLNRQRHEIDAIIALQQMSQGKTGGKPSENIENPTQLKFKDFELMPEGFREYYEEFLSLID